MNIKTIREEADMTDDRRVTKVFEAVNKNLIGKGKQKIGRGNRRTKTIWILNSDSGL